MIENLRLAPNPAWKTKGFFDLRTKNFLIHGCRLVLADTGRLIAMMPYREYMSGGRKGFDPVIEVLDVDYLEAVTAQAIEAFNLLTKKPAKVTKIPGAPAPQEGSVKV